MKDLEIRGAGNLLGPEQSGFMNSVGFDLYCRLLAQAVDELRGKRTLPEYDLVIDLPLGAHLPDDYIGDPDLKVRLYRRLADLATEEEVEAVEREFLDRFGPLPAAGGGHVLRPARQGPGQGPLPARASRPRAISLVIRTSPFVVTDRLALYKAFGTSRRGAQSAGAHPPPAAAGAVEGGPPEGPAHPAGGGGPERSALPRSRPAAGAV